MSQPRRLRTRKGNPSVETMPRKPSHFTSNAQSLRAGIGPERASRGSGRALYDATAAQPILGQSTSSENAQRLHLRIDFPIHRTCLDEYLGNGTYV